MPRSDKPISTGNLSDPVSSARGRNWASHAGPEHSDQYEPDGLVAVDQLTQETVEGVIDLVDPDAPKVTVVDRKLNPTPVEPIPEYEWTTVRTIEGRMYMRLDERYQVNAEDKPPKI
jgi:hypothetical protein